ncbi:MAG: ABC transporter permease [Bryobacterales bacterium]|nr:ABC transporter permease [Bryobacterales bacterium]
MLRVRLEPVGGDAAGWQLLDGRTSALIEEGPWVTEASDSEVPVPADDGDYRVLVSTVNTERGWAYSQGARMRVLDVTVRSGAVTVTRDRHTTLAGLRWSGLPARLTAFLFEPWLLLWGNRNLIASMVGRDLEARYKGSYGDRAWTFAQPLLLMLAYWFVFGLVLKTRFGDDSNPSIYMLFFLCGMLPWLAISEAVGRAPNVILEHRNFVKKLVFPVEILPANLVFSGLVSSGLALIVYLFFLMATREHIPPEALWLPVVLVPQAVFTLGVCWAWAGLGLFARDLAQVNGFLLTLVFFLTPICYPMEKLPARAVTILQKSPVYKLVGEYRLLFISESAPDWMVMGQLMGMSLVIFYLGYGVFRKLRPSFPDVL